MKQIYVQAQADHIESLFKGSPLAAIEELVWNALDADAKEVKVDLVTNPLGAVEAVRVTDDGTGIDALRADQTFGNLGGSWKRWQKITEEAAKQCGRTRVPEVLSVRPLADWLKQPAESALLFCYENEDQQPIKAVLRALPEDVHRITVLVIEHNLDVIKTADYLIDLGPEGGDGGGTLVACGTPEAVAEIPESYTGQYLKSYLK